MVDRAATVDRLCAKGVITAEGRGFSIRNG